MSAQDDYREGYNEGYRDGKSEARAGKAKGRFESSRDPYDKGYVKGYSAGYEEELRKYQDSRQRSSARSRQQNTYRSNTNQRSSSPRRNASYDDYDDDYDDYDDYDSPSALHRASDAVASATRKAKVTYAVGKEVGKAAVKTGKVAFKKATSLPVKRIRKIAESKVEFREISTKETICCIYDSTKH